MAVVPVTPKNAGSENDGSTAAPALARSTFGTLAPGDTILVGLSHTGIATADIATAGPPTPPFVFLGELVAPTSAESSLHVYLGQADDWGSQAANFTFPISTARGGCLLGWWVAQGDIDVAAVMYALLRTTASAPAISITPARDGSFVACFTSAKPASGTLTGTPGGTGLTWSESIDTSVSATSFLHGQRGAQTTAALATAQPTILSGGVPTAVSAAQAIVVLQPLAEAGAPVDDPAPVPGVPVAAVRELRARPLGRVAYTFELVDAIARVPLAEVVGASARSVTLARNRPGSASFSLPLGMAEPLRSLLRVGGELDLWVWRDGVPLWGGPILGARPSIDTAGGTVEFAALGIGEILADRYTAAPYSIPAREQTQAAFDLITVAQGRPNGALAIDAGTLPDSVARTLEFQAPSPIIGAIEALADSDRGFDFEFTPTAAYRYTFNAWYPGRGSDRGVVLERGRNVSGVPDATLDATRGRLINAATVVGAGGAWVAAEDGGSQITRRRREVVATAEGDDSSDAVRLGDIARGLIRASSPRAVPRLELLPGAPDAGLDRIGLGDLVGVEVTEGWFGVRGNGYRVEQIVVALSDGPEPVEHLEVTVSEPET